MSRFRIKGRSMRYLSFFLLFAAVVAWHACGGGSSGVSTPSVPDGKTITLGWTPPTSHTDGTPITGFTGYIIYYGPSPGNYNHSVDVGNTTTYSITLSPGTWYFAMRAYTTPGYNSDFSNEIAVTF